MNPVRLTPSHYISPLEPVYDGCTFCAAVWITVFVCTTIHELGHVLAAKMCGLQVTDLKIGAPLFEHMGIPQRFSFETPNKMHLHFGGLNPFPGRIRTAPSSHLSSNQVIVISALGPLAGGLASGIIYDACQQFNDNTPPFLLGIRLSSFLFLISQVLSLFPFKENSDGSKILTAIIDY